MNPAALPTANLAPPSARQKQADDTRARLFMAAAQLFASEGYHETTVDKIARQAGVAKGTFFVHFPTKGAVVTELVGIQTRAARKARDLVQAEGPVARVRAAVIELGTQAGLSRGVSRAVLAATLENPEVGGTADALFGEVFSLMVKDAREAQKAGELAASPEARVMASALMASYLGATLYFTTSRESEPLLDILNPLVDANITGFRSGLCKKESPHGSIDRARRPRDRRAR